MGRQAEIYVKESLLELQAIKRKHKNFPVLKKLNALIELKKQETLSRQQLAQYLGVGKRSLERWLSIYKRDGIDGLVVIKPRRKGSKLISSAVHKSLKERVESIENPFLGYWDAHEWIQKEHDVAISYYWLRNYLIKHFGTKVKSTRKSHIKKDEGAVALFKKPT